MEPKAETIDLTARLEKLTAGGDPLVKLRELIPWEKFRSCIQKALKKHRKTNAGRKPFDYVMMFKILILQTLYNLSDHQIEYQIRDRLSFLRFLQLDLSDDVPDEKTVWLFREQLIEGGVLKKLFDRFEQFLIVKGYTAKVGMIIDSSLIEAPKQRNNRDENHQIKNGGTPEEWEEEPNKLRQKDVDARWTMKNNQTYYGYKNHINIDVEHKLIRKFVVTPASTADVSCFEDLLDKKNKDKKVWADSAYRSEKTEKMLAKKSYKSRLHYKVKQGHYLPENYRRINYGRSVIRVRVEHAFGFMQNSMGRKFIRTIGIMRAQMKIGMMNLTYNICRYAQLTEPVRA